MYNIDDLLGKVVTIRANGGDEYIAKLLGTDDEHATMVLEHPRMVVINENNVALVPFSLTSDTSEVIFSTSTILAVMPTMERTAEDYIRLVSQDATDTTVSEV